MSKLLLTCTLVAVTVLNDKRRVSCTSTFSKADESLFLASQKVTLHLKCRVVRRP